MNFAYYFNMACWVMFGVVWNLAVFDLISMETEEALTLGFDFTAKV
jgi:hypothetical protein